MNREEIKRNNKASKKEKKMKTGAVVQNGFSTKPQPPGDLKAVANNIMGSKAFQDALNKLNSGTNPVVSASYVPVTIYTKPEVVTKPATVYPINKHKKDYVAKPVVAEEEVIDLGLVWPITHGIPEEKTGPFMYHICSDGMYCSKNVLGNKYVTYKVDKMPGLPVGKEDKNVLESKIPLFLFNKTVEFFKYIIKTEKKDLEAFVLYGYNKDTKKHFIWIPEQQISAAAVSYDISEFYTLYPNCTIIGDAHSHNNMGAFWSGTDDGDDKRDRFSVVVGKLSKIFPEFKIRFCTHDKRWDLEIDDLYEEDSDDYEFNLSWEEELKKINKRTYTTSYVTPHATNPNSGHGYSGYGYGQGYGGYYGQGGGYRNTEKTANSVTTYKPDYSVHAGTKTKYGVFSREISDSKEVDSQHNAAKLGLGQCDICKGSFPRYDLEVVEDVTLCDSCKGQFSLKASVRAESKSSIMTPEELRREMYDPYEFYCV